MKIVHQEEEERASIQQDVKGLKVEEVFLVRVEEALVWEAEELCHEACLVEALVAVQMEKAELLLQLENLVSYLLAVLEEASRLPVEEASRLPVEEASRLPVEEASQLLVEEVLQLLVEVVSQQPEEEALPLPEVVA